MKTDNYKNEPNRENILENLADKTGLAIIVVEGENSQTVAKSNNNSICEILYNSAEFAPRCAMYCGKAVQTAMEAGKAVAVKCHADLNYFTVPLDTDENRPTAAIIGRTFIKSEDYRKAAERAISGDWQQFASEELFKNMLLSGSVNEIEKAVKYVEKLNESDKKLLAQPEVEKVTLSAENNFESTDQSLLPITQADEITKLIEKFHQNNLPQTIVSKPLTEKNLEENEGLAAWRSLFGSLLELSYKEACLSVLQFLAKRFEIENLAWLVRKNNGFEAVLGIGDFAGQHIQVPVPADEGSLLEAIKKESALEFRERKNDKNVNARQTVNLFPIATGNTVHSGVIVGGIEDTETTKNQIAKFLRNVAWELELLRLRELVERQSWTTRAIQKLNENIKRIDSEDYWTILAQISAELMNAEQSSLLLFDDDSKEFLVKAAIGSRAEMIRKEPASRIGSRVAQSVMRSGKPLVIGDTAKAGLKTVVDREYKTNSFISYPILISGRKIGVLNITDKIDGGNYTENDLELLDTFIPQIAVALDRTSLMQKAGEFEQLSITDSLTGLVNRRYLEQRLTEEIKRSQRDGYPLSFMMIDADSFKQYNDTYGHTEGDTALQIIGQCLKATLRGADVAARYGGEEFSILLPQTTLNEAFTIAERLRAKIASTIFPNQQVTVSIGVSTCYRTSCNSHDLISGADKALYEAKKMGRNNVQIHRNPID